MKKKNISDFLAYATSHVLKILQPIRSIAIIYIYEGRTGLGPQARNKYDT